MNINLLFSLIQEDLTDIIIPKGGIDRYVNIALPYLLLYSPIGSLITVGSEGAHVVKKLHAIVTTIQAGDWEQSKTELMEGAILTVSIAGKVLYPMVHSFVSTGMELGEDIRRLGTSMWKQDFSEAGLAFLTASHKVVSLGSLVLGSTPQLVMISLAGKALIECTKAVQEYHKGNYLETASHIGLSLLYYNKFHSQLEGIEKKEEEEIGKKLKNKVIDTQESFDDLMRGLKAEQAKDPEKLIDILEYLNSSNKEAAYYALDVNKVLLKDLEFNKFVFDGVNFSECRFENSHFKNSLFEWTKFSDCQFTNCRFGENYFDWSNFSGCHLNSCHFEENHFEYCTFNKVVESFSVFKECLFEETNWFSCSFLKTHFLNCDMEKSVWNYSKMEEVEWQECDLTKAAFHDTKLAQGVFNSCILKEARFLGAQVNGSRMERCDLTDCLLFRSEKSFTFSECAPLKTTRPVIALLWSYRDPPAYGGLTKEVLEKDYNAIVIPVEYGMEDIDTETLTKEVDQSLNLIKEKSIKLGGISIPQFVMKNTRAKSEVRKIQMKAEELMETADVLWLPGGNDINPKFYGEQQNKETSPDSDDRRTILEFAVIHEARKHHISTIGVCRGNQILNVESGGTLKQDVDEHWDKVHLMEVESGESKPFKVFREAIGGNEIYGTSMHHQSIGKVGKGFNAVLEHEGHVEAMVRDDGLAIGLQFHPEGVDVFRPERREGEQGSQENSEANLSNLLDSLHEKLLDDLSELISDQSMELGLAGSIVHIQEWHANQEFFAYVIKQAETHRLRRLRQLERRKKGLNRHLA